MHKSFYTKCLDRNIAFYYHEQERTFNYFNIGMDYTIFHYKLTPFDSWKQYLIWSKIR